jgi:PTH1 family peptidyl-tRNA hydrolase
LGNPGKEYEGTRHNVGFRIVRGYAQSLGVSFKRLREFLGEVAQHSAEGETVLLLLPMTYMNESGQSVQRCAEYFKIPSQHVLVVCDDVALPFGQLRMRERGGAGGHKGLRSVEAFLGTQEYPRLRVGVGERAHLEQPLADHVLGRFLQEEEALLPRIVETAESGIRTWVREGCAKAAQLLAASKDKESGT